MLVLAKVAYCSNKVRILDHLDSGLGGVSNHKPMEVSYFMCSCIFIKLHSVTIRGYGEAAGDVGGYMYNKNDQTNKP